MFSIDVFRHALQSCVLLNVLNRRGFLQRIEAFEEIMVSMRSPADPEQGLPARISPDIRIAALMSKYLLYRYIEISHYFPFAMPSRTRIPIRAGTMIAIDSAQVVSPVRAVPAAPIITTKPPQNVLVFNSLPNILNPLEFLQPLKRFLQHRRHVILCINLFFY